MHRTLSFLFALLASSLCTQEPASAEIKAPTLTQEAEVATIYPSNSEYVLLRGLLISGKKEKQLIGAFSGVRCDHIRIPGGEKKLSKVLSSYLGKPVTNSLLESIKRDVMSYYKQENHPLIFISFPEQDVSLGVVQLSVLESVVGKVTVKGNHWTKEKGIHKEIRFRPNEPIDEDLLIQDLYWLNRNPYAQAYVVYTPGEKTGTTDIEVIVKDRMPLRAYAGTDNIGNDVTGNLRLFAGLNIGNIFGNQLFSYQFTCDHECRKFMAHSAFYKAPLPWRHELVLFGGYSWVDAKYRVGSNPLLFHSKGFSTQASLRYDIPLYPRKHVLSEATFGFDFKRTDNALAYGVIPLFPNGHFANVTQVMAGYNIGYTQNITISFEIEGFWSPGRSGQRSNRCPV